MWVTNNPTSLVKRTKNGGSPSFVIDGVRCQPRRSKRAAWDNLIEVGNAGWRGSDAVAPSFLVKVRA